MALRILAVAAPNWPEKNLGNSVLTSRDPASLFNACRYAAFLSENGIGPWGESNWATSRQNRRKTLLLMHSLREEIASFEELLQKEKPNLLLIGAMTLCLPGAIACAKRAKEILGEKVCIILGGWHTTETIYFSNCSLDIKHHPSSPLRPMAEGHIKPVFDIVVSGDGEHVIAKIGEIVDFLDRKHIQISEIRKYLTNIAQVSGSWIVGWLESDQIITIEGGGGLFGRDELPSPCAMFGIQTSFKVFKGRLTAHVFSDISRGCAYDCAFCSERSSVCGSLIQINTSAQRLFKQLSDAVRVVEEDSPTLKASAFVEDSTLLAGSTTALHRLIDLISESKLDLRFGGQLTIDQILNRVEILPDLKRVGLDYLFSGLETIDPESIGGMSKVQLAKDRWLDRAEKVFSVLSNTGITCGIALLFGLGETRDSRIKLFECIKKWRKCYGFPEPIALNWAVQHPLKGDDGGTAYRYVKWGVPSGPYVEAFQDFGEASLYYPVAGQKQPTIKEVEEVRQMYCELLE